MWLVSIKRSFQGLLGVIETMGIIKYLMEIWPNKVYNRAFCSEMIYFPIVIVSPHFSMLVYLHCIGSCLWMSKTSFFSIFSKFSKLFLSLNSLIAFLLDLSKLNTFLYQLSKESEFLDWPTSTSFYASARWTPFLNKPTKVTLLYLESSFQIINFDQKSSSSQFSCFSLVSFSIVWVWVSIDMKNYAILSTIFSQVSKGGLLVIVDISSSLLVPFYSFWKSRNFLICVSVQCLTWLSFPPLIFPKAILILSHSFEISLLWKNSVIF